MARGLIFLIGCIVVGGLFLLLASQISENQPPAGAARSDGSAGAGVADGEEGDRAGGGNAGSSAAGAPRSELMEEDREAAKAIAAPDAVEAREWCKPERRSMGFEVTKNDMAKWTEELYGLGAQKVVVVGIEKIEDVEIAASMVVVLPDDKAQRQKLFDWYNNLFDPETEDRALDVGQKYMYLTFD